MDLKAVRVKPIDTRLFKRDYKMLGYGALAIYTYVELEIRIAVENVHGIIHSEVFYQEPDEWDEKIEQSILERLRDEAG